MHDASSQTRSMFRQRRHAAMGFESIPTTASGDVEAELDLRRLATPRSSALSRHWSVCRPRFLQSPQSLYGVRHACVVFIDVFVDNCRSRLTYLGSAGYGPSA